MADTVRKVEYFSLPISDKPGEAFKVLSALVSAGINLLACTGTQRGRRARIDVVPDDTRKFKAAAKKAGLAFQPEKSGFLVQGDDRPGALVQNLKKLVDGGVNVSGIDGGTAGEARFGVILWFEPPEVRKAGKLLGAK